jgi:hypothetical protein
MAAKGKSKISFEWLSNIREMLFSTTGLPFFLAFTTLAVLFVLFRMKNVEKDYQISKTNKDIEKVLLDNKELKAKKARMLSSEKLRKLASIHHLEQPKQDQIIVIP